MCPSLTNLANPPWATPEGTYGRIRSVDGRETFIHLNAPFNSLNTRSDAPEGFAILFRNWATLCM